MGKRGKQAAKEKRDGSTFDPCRTYFLDPLKAQYLPERARMMQRWADLLDALANADSNVVPWRFGKAAQAA